MEHNVKLTYSPLYIDIINVVFTKIEFNKPDVKVKLFMLLIEGSALSLINLIYQMFRNKPSYLKFNNLSLNKQKKRSLKIYSPFLIGTGVIN